MQALHSFNIKNTQDLLKTLEDTPMFPHYNLASLDFTNLYSNIPVKETLTYLTFNPTPTLILFCETTHICIVLYIVYR